ncbi:ABC transporter, ATP-binding protein [Collinsella intestinalis DSM 13280]|uniref:ABC transporter, ATP-binding protein n=1 Tax=Collinsella intestinalis DSM 13280 TaxID=521003 RepID=C4FCC1_9ACTN|nr:ATP-binding cassette domain-containing protein [Collinsella intestinalis]EEP43559.1 ABC transporter, ATP-binding protein [Collinsella intestinalis DSM 13280]
MISIKHVYKSFATPKASGKTRRKVGADVSYAASVSGNPALGAAAVVQAADEAAETLAPVESDGLVHALSDINIDIADGDVFGIIGMSGAGKSTLVRTINLLERPTSGTIEVDGRDVTALSGEELRAYRRRVAMIFQNFGLLAQKTVLDNVCFPFLAASGKVTAENRARALELLDRVGLAEKAQSYPSQLSGGQKQRVAIARALACEPEVILCDEATSALDPKSTNTILKLLRDINRETGVTLVVITHSMDVVEKICNNVAVLEHGRVVEQGSVAKVFADPQAEATRVLLGKVDWDA